MKNHLHSLLYCALGGVILLSGCNKDEPNGNGSNDKENADFTFETLELTQGSFGVKISPIAKEQTYYFGIVSKADYAQFASPEELQAADVERIKQIAASNNLDLEKFLLEALLKGDQTWTYTALAPETDYVFYAYGLSTDCTIQTPLNTYSFKTPAVTPVDIKFEITTTDLKPTSFTLNVKPSLDNCSYYYDVITPDQYKQYGSDLKSFVEAFLYEWKKTDKYKSYTMPQFVDEVTVKGEISDNRFENLLPEGTYHALAVAVANDGTCMSEVEVLTFQTTESPRNEYTVSNQDATDISFAAMVSAKESEAFAVMMELKEYFFENGKELSDIEIIKAIYEANNKNISKYMFADAAKVQFNDLIPNDEYYLLVFACNPDGTPKLDPDKVNLKKVEVKTEPARKSNAKFSLKVMESTITRNSVGIQVELDDPKTYEYETFLVNYIKDSEYQQLPDKEKGLQYHMDKYIDAELKKYNDNKKVNMTRKEFLSRNLFSDKKGAVYATITLEGMESDTKYQVYLIGLKADGTYTTAPVLAECKTISETQCMASLEFAVQAYKIKENMDKYWVWIYPKGNFKEFYVKSFVGNDEWAGKKASEVEKLLKVEDNKAPVMSNYQSLMDVEYGQTWSLYAVIYDVSGQASDIYKLQHTCPETGDGRNDVMAEPVYVEVGTVDK